MFLTYFKTLLHTNPTKSCKIPTTPVGFQNPMFVGMKSQDFEKSSKSFKLNMGLGNDIQSNSTNQTGP